MARKQQRQDEYGQGRFLCVESLYPGAISFRNPREPKGLLDITVQPYQTEVITEDWLDVPNFILRLQEGMIRVFRSETIPPRRDFSVPRELHLDHPTLNAQSIRVVSTEVFGKIEQSIIETNPKTAGDMLDKEWLKESFSKFLKNVRHRESRWRNRPEVLKAVDDRLEQIRVM